MAKQSLVLGDVILDWDEDSVYKDQACNYEGSEQEIYEIVALDYDLWDYEYKWIHGVIWDTFEKVCPKRYVEFIVFRPYHYGTGLEYVKDWDALRTFLRLENYTEIKVQRATYGIFPALSVTWRDYHSGVSGDVLIVDRRDSVCPICETAYDSDCTDGERDRAFIRKWGRCPFCVEEAIIEFCQGVRTDDTAFLYQPGDYLMWDRKRNIVIDMAAVDFYLNDEAKRLLEEVKNPVPGDPLHFMYGR